MFCHVYTGSRTDEYKRAGNVLKGFSLVQFIFDIDTVFKGKVLLVSWNIFTHGYPSFYCCQKERYPYHFYMKE